MVKGTQDIAYLAHVGLFRTDCKEVTIVCVKWNNLRKRS